jgi:TPR repeat protein
MVKMVELTRQVLMEDPSNAESLYYMGLFLEQGIGIDKNTESCLYYIDTAARLEHPPAISKLGDFYYNGFGVKKDLDYAKVLYEKAAEKRDSKALISLGAMMEKGIGFTEKDPRKAYELYEKAASMGNPDAMIILSSTG